MSDKGIPAKTIRAMLQEEMGDGTGEVETPDEPPTPKEPGEPKPPISEPPPTQPPPPPISSDMQALVSALVTGITQAQASSADAIKDALGNAASMAREPIPENKIDPGKSVYSHPDGDAKTPRTKLRCPMFLGIYDEHGAAKPAFEIYEDTCTEVERIELNKLRHGVYPGIERNDGVKATWRVVQQMDDNQQPTRLIIAVPQLWLSQEQFMLMPGQLNFLRQLNAQAVVAAA